MIGYNNRRRGFVTCFGNTFGIELQEKLSAFNFVARVGFRRETFAVELNGVHTDVNQKFNAVIGLQTYRVMRGEKYGNFTVERRINFAFGIFNRRAASHCASFNGINVPLSGLLMRMFFIKPTSLTYRKKHTCSGDKKISFVQNQ